MSFTKIHTFDPADTGARLWWQGVAYRAKSVYHDDDGELWVFVVRQTKRGRDFRNGTGTWLTASNTLERFPAGYGLAAYVRAIVGGEVNGVKIKPPRFSDSDPLTAVQ